MTGKVIQGFFAGGWHRVPAPVAQLPAVPRQSGPTIPAITGRTPMTQSKARLLPPGPPAPAFDGRRPVAQARGSADSFQVEAGQLGLVSGGGRPLPDAVRGKMEAALGADFSAVRVHVGPQAERIGAIAFTMGTDIYFAPGRFQPDTAHGQQLLGHELAHVVQQRQGRVRNPMGTGVTVVQDRALEAEADRLGHRAAIHRIEVQAKIASGAAQPPSPVRISAPISHGPGSYRLTAGAGGRQVGSVMVHVQDKASVEVTDLGVDQAHREHGIGKMLIASAARTGLQSGKTKVTLAAQDNGSGRLTQWYKGMGFAQVGVNRRGYPRMEAPVGRVLAAAAQRKMQLDTPSQVQTPAVTWRSPETSGARGPAAGMLPGRAFHVHRQSAISIPAPMVPVRSGSTPAIQRSQELVVGLPSDVSLPIFGGYLTEDDRRSLGQVSKASRRMVQDVRRRLAILVLQNAIIKRFGKPEVGLAKRNATTKISAARIVDSILNVLKSEGNQAIALEKLIASASWWPAVKQRGKPNSNQNIVDGDGLIGALAKLASANLDADVKGALGEIQDAVFFTSRFGGMVDMDRTKTYERLLPGQYLDTVKSKQMDVVFSNDGITYYVETKFDVTTAIGKHAPTTNKKELAERARNARKTLTLAEDQPVTVPFEPNHPLARLPEVSQQLLGYQAAAEHRMARTEKPKKILRVVSIPHSRGWLRLFTETPSTAGLYIELGWYLRVGTVIFSPDDMRKIQKMIFLETLGDEAPSYRTKNAPDSREALKAYTAKNIDLAPEDFEKKLRQ